jgi:hypothetical protein
MLYLKFLLSIVTNAMQWWTLDVKGCILNENLVDCWLSMDFEKLRKPKATNLLVSWWVLKDQETNLQNNNIQGLATHESNPWELCGGEPWALRRGLKVMKNLVSMKGWQWHLLHSQLVMVNSSSTHKNGFWWWLQWSAMCDDDKSVGPNNVWQAPYLCHPQEWQQIPIAHN